MFWLRSFFGTAILTSVVLAQVGAVGAILSSPWFIAVTAGLTMSVLVMTVSRISGGHFNPAITLGLWSVRRIPTTTTIALIAAQMLGGIVALALYQYLGDRTLAEVAGEFDWRVFVAELSGAFIFAHGVAASVMQGYRGFKAAFTIGASLSLGIIVAATASNGILNPAMAVGLRSWSWTYGLAPVVGAFMGFNFYNIFFRPTEEIVLEDSVQNTSKTRSRNITRKKTLNFPH